MTTTYDSLESIANNVTNIAKEVSNLLNNVPTSSINEEEVRSIITSVLGQDTSGSSVSVYPRHIATNFSAGRNGVRIPILYLDGDISEMTKDNKVTLSYRFQPTDGGVISGTCSCKWQGASSVNWPKKNYSLTKMSNAIDVGWGSNKKYVVKADYMDPSISRNVFAAKLWGKIVRTRDDSDALITRLKQMPNCGAVDGFHCILVMNNIYKGIYNFNIPKDAWMMGMGSGNQEAIFVADAESIPTLFRETATKEDILAELVNFAIEYVPDENNPDWAINSLNNVITIAMQNTEAAWNTLKTTHFSVNNLVDYYIHACITENWDGIDHNYIIATLDGTKWFFVPYDLDGTCGMAHVYGLAYSKADYNPKMNNFSGYRRNTTEHRLFKLLRTYDKALLKSRYIELRNSVLSEDNVNYEFMKYFSEIPQELFREEFTLWPYRNMGTIDPYAQFTTWYRLRCEYLDAEVESWNV